MTNKRVSQGKETITCNEWPSSSVYKDFEYLEVEKWDGTKAGDIKARGGSITVTGLTERKQYEYRCYSVDYAGNRGGYFVCKDVTGPTIPKEESATGYSNSRTSTDKETLTWTNSTDPEVDIIEIECWNTVNKTKVENVFTQNKDNKETSHTFTGLTNQIKYEYRIYSYDYAGNKSENYYKYQDDIGPQSPINLDVGSINSGVIVFFDKPNDNEIDHYDFYKGDTKQNSVHYSELNNGHAFVNIGDISNGSKCNINIYAVDFSGNKSDVATITNAKAGIKPGDYCYLKYNKLPYFISDFKRNDENNKLVGIVVAPGEYSGNYISAQSVRIISINKTAAKVFCNNENVAKSYSGYSSNGLNFYNDVTKSANLSSFPIIKYLYEEVNNNNPITWYLPSKDECLYFNGKDSKSETQRKLIVEKLTGINNNLNSLNGFNMITCTITDTKVYQVSFGDGQTGVDVPISGLSESASVLMAQVNPNY